MTTKEKSTVTKLTLDVFDKLPAGKEFHGHEIKNLVVRLEPDYAFKYEDTFMRILRKHRRMSFKCISHEKSLYRKEV